MLVGAMSKMAGDFEGSSSLWLGPESPADVSDATVTVSSVMQGTFLQVDYTWAREGKPQQGRILLSSQEGKLTAVWLDTWHNSDTLMVQSGEVVGTTLTLKGTYPAGEGPDWGWRTELDGADPKRFVMTMYNILPDGREARAVLLEASRR